MMTMILPIQLYLAVGGETGDEVVEGLLSGDVGGAKVVQVQVLEHGVLIPVSIQPSVVKVQWARMRLCSGVRPQYLHPQLHPWPLLAGTNRLQFLEVRTRTECPDLHLHRRLVMKTAMVLDGRT